MQRRSLLTMLSTASIVSLAGCLDSSGSDSIRSEDKEMYIDIAKQSALRIDNWLEARGDTTVRLSNLGDIESGDVATVQARIDEETTRLPDDVTDIHYINMENEKTIATSRPQLQPLGLDSDGDGDVDEYDFTTLSNNEAPWVTRSIDDLQFGDDDLFISEPVFALRQSNIYFISPVETDGDRDIVLTMQANLNALSGDLGTGEENRFTQVVNQQGKVVADSSDDVADLEEGINEYPRFIEGEVPQFVNDGLNGNTEFVESFDRHRWLDEDHAIGYAPVTNINLVVLTYIPVSSL